MSFFTKLFGDPNEKYLKKLRPTVDKINNLEHRFENFSMEQLREKTEEFKESLKSSCLEDILPEAFAVVREVSKRTLYQRHYDVQIMGAIALHEGKIAEMKTGEGKTLAATMPVYLNAITGKGVHMVTVNDYLARRDTVWMGQIYHALGLTIGCVNQEQSFLYDPDYKKTSEEKEKMRDEMGSFHVVEDFLRPCSRKEAYGADITYGTNNHFGFDYLRDHMAYSSDQRVQRGFNFAILDEIDSILIDEARTPLNISQPDYEASGMYKDFSRIVPKLEKEADYNIDEKLKAATLTEQGIEKIEDILKVDNIYQEKGIKYLHHLEQALKAEVFFKKDRDYVVREGQVVIVDEFTGRLMPGRRYSGGLHQAIEAKEGLKVNPESKTLATITFQNLFRMYNKLSGMTGTAITSKEEFEKVYNLSVLQIPTHKPMIRKDMPDVVYKTQMAKFKAIASDVKERNSRGQPVLIGTSSIERNELLSKILTREGINHRLLNAKHHEKEGEIIAQAGKKGAVTVATNMAGRGVDIVLGGNPPEKAQEIKEAGGLHVIGAQRHEARRIDNQLRGRSGRQGDPGSSQFYVSLEDYLIRVFGGEKIGSLMGAFNLPEDQPIESKLLSGSIESAQKKVEGHNFDARKHILQYDEVVAKHRNKIYTQRDGVLDKSYNHMKDYVMSIIKEEVENIVSANILEEGFNYSQIIEDLRTIFPAPEGMEGKLKQFEGKEDMISFIMELAEETFKNKETQEGKENMERVMKFVCLRTIDFLWAQHLEAMDRLKDSVRLRAYGGKDPLIEYKSEGHRMFQQLEENINSDIARSIFKLTVKQEES